MKTRIFILIFALLFTGVNFTQDKGTKPKNNVIGQIKKIIKDVYYIDLAKKEVKIEAKMLDKSMVRSNEQVKTGDNSIAIVKFIDSTVLKIQPNSLVTILGGSDSKGNNSSIQSNTTISKGSTHFEVKKQSANSDFKFTTPTMVASIRGTTGFIKVDNDSVNTFTLEEGAAYIEASNGAKGNGNVTAGKTATVTAAGQVLIADTEPALKTEMNKAKNSANKYIRIKATEGSVTIYYNDEKK